MAMPSTRVVAVTDVSQVSYARQQALALARSIDFPETATANLALIVTEMATNLLKHSEGGEILLRHFYDKGSFWMEAISVDRGPGMANIKESLRDGFSTKQSSGTGLGAIRRLSQEFDIYSQLGKGTAVLARLSLRARPSQELSRNQNLEIGAVQVPNVGEEICGDAWTFCRDRSGMLLLVADGLGHGPQAATASRRATAFVEDNSNLDLIPQLQGTHEALRGSRGAALALAQLSVTERTVRFAGLGNIAGVIANAEARHYMVSHSGTAGMEVRRFQEFLYSWPERVPVILHSDGLGTKWDLTAYRGLADCHAGLIAAVLYRDWSRRQDDVTVVVVKEKE